MAPKRKSSASAGRPKKCKFTPVVMDALQSEAIAEGDRTLFSKTVPVALSAFKADRHAFETEVVQQAEQGLKAAQQALVAQHKEALAAQNQVISNQELASRKQGKETAEKNLEAAKSDLEEKKNNKKLAEKAVEDAQEALKSAKKEEKDADRDLQKIIGKKNTVESMLTNDFTALKNGEGGKAQINKVVSVGKDYCGPTLLQTFPIACKSKERSEFENVTFTTLEGQINKAIEDLNAQVAESQPVKDAKSAAVAAAEEALKAAQEAAKSAGDAQEAASTARSEAAKGVTKADGHLRHIWADMQKACDAQDALAAKVKHFEEEVWTAFNALKEKEPEPEPVEEPAAEEPAAETAPAETAPAA